MSTPQTYRGNGNHEWEHVSIDGEGVTFTRRLRVPGGWIYNMVLNVGNEVDGNKNIANSVFVPMPEVVGKPI